MSESSRHPKSSIPLVITLLLGLASASLYYLLFLYADQFALFSEKARQGDTLFALIPLVVALIFSLVHGAFTGYFWELLGLKPKK